MNEIALIDNRTGGIITAEDAWQRHRRIVDLRNQAEGTFLELGKELYWFEAEKQYKTMGYETFEAYLADPEVDIGRRMAFRLKGVYKTFQLELKSAQCALLEAGTEKLDVIRPHVTPGNVEEWVGKAAALSRSDLRAELGRAFPPPPAPPLPVGQFNVLYADPAWEYSNAGLGGAAAGHYATMDTRAICDLPIPSMCAEDAVLFLWATNPLLPDALAVVAAWGFEYKTNFVWVKDRQTYGKLGFYNFGRHELLLLATKGSFLPDEDDRLPSVIVENKREHSRKPDGVYEMIERMYPNGERVELFARYLREGWTSWGNEVGEQSTGIAWE